MVKSGCVLFLLLFFVAACGTVNPVPTVTATPSVTLTEQNTATATSTVTITPSPSPSSTTTQIPTASTTPTTSPTPTVAIPTLTATISPLDTFIDGCKKPDSNDVSCLYVEGVLALKLQRLDGLFFPKQEGVAEVWNEAWNEGQVISILAHNNSEGIRFYHLAVDQIIYLIWTNGKVEKYRIVEQTEWRNEGKMLLFSPWNGGSRLSDDDLIDRYYREGDNFNKMVLQTCLGNNQEGLLFLVAYRIQNKIRKLAN